MKWLKRRIVEWLLSDIHELRVGRTIVIDGSAIKLASLIADPALEEGKLFFRGDLDELRFSPNGVKLINVVHAHELHEASGTGYTTSTAPVVVATLTPPAGLLWLMMALKWRGRGTAGWANLKITWEDGTVSETGFVGLGNVKVAYAYGEHTDDPNQEDLPKWQRISKVEVQAYTTNPDYVAYGDGWIRALIVP